MLMKHLAKIRAAFVLSILPALLFSCAKDDYFSIDTSTPESASQSSSTKGRIVPEINRNVMIMISGGRNSLSGFLTEDLRELEGSDIPLGNYASGNVLLVLSRIGGDKTSEAPAVLYRLYRDRNSNPVRDTLRVWDGFVPLFGENTLKSALRYVVSEFPGSNYGIVLSSHGTGYLPCGYYSDPSAYERESFQFSSLRKLRGGNVKRLTPEVFEPIPEYPAVKSIGQDVDPSESVEMDIKAFRDALPCQMDYILFDACLMGTVEVAYELRDKARIIGFSPTEILADGFDYNLLASRLLSESPDPVQVCRDYFEQYRVGPDGSSSNAYPYATISALDTRYLEELAAVCKTLFEKYRSGIDGVNERYVQRYYRFERHFFYDLRDILSKSGVSDEDLEKLDAVLEKLVIYKDHTPYFMSIPISDASYSGLSMYLPKMGSSFLDAYYMENMDWNTDTQLVK